MNIFGTNNYNKKEMLHFSKSNMRPKWLRFATIYPPFLGEDIFMSIMMLRFLVKLIYEIYHNKYEL